MEYRDSGFAGDVGYDTSISLDSSDRPHISYFGSGQTLRYAKGTPTGPSSPQNLQASCGDSFVNIAWTALSNDGGLPVTNYVIRKGTSPGGETFLIEIGNLSHFNDTTVNSITY